MPDIIFIHCQSFSRKPNRAGQSVAQVIGEGLRAGGYDLHVAEPRAPIPVFGDPSTFQQSHDAHVAQRNTRVIKGEKTSTRAIRHDRHTLFSIVASYPTPTRDLQASPAEAARFERWAALTLAWVRDQYGDQVKVAFAHLDEVYPHLHFWCLASDPGADASQLHPGKAAKRETERRLKAEGLPPREAVKAGNRALKDAMRSWIDSYHREVGAPLGMNRDGPKRRRLSRAQHQAEQAMLDHHRRLEEDRVRLEAEVAALEARSAVMAEQQRRLKEKTDVFFERAERHHDRMQREANQIAAIGPLLDAVVREIENKTISFDPEHGWRLEDPNRPLKNVTARNAFPLRGCWVGLEHTQADLPAASPVRLQAVSAALRDCRPPLSA